MLGVWFTPLSADSVGRPAWARRCTNSPFLTSSSLLPSPSLWNFPESKMSTSLLLSASAGQLSCFSVMFYTAACYQICRFIHIFCALSCMLRLILNRNLCDWWSGWTSVRPPDILSPPLCLVSFCLWCHPSLRLIVRNCDCGLAKWLGQQEFAIPQNVLGIVYGQTICWIGTFYSPILPAICTIKYFFIFYIKKVGFLFFLLCI